MLNFSIPLTTPWSTTIQIAVTLSPLWIKDILILVQSSSLPVHLQAIFTGFAKLYQFFFFSPPYLFSHDKYPTSNHLHDLASPAHSSAAEIDLFDMVKKILNLCNNSFLQLL